MLGCRNSGGRRGGGLDGLAAWFDRCLGGIGAIRVDGAVRTRRPGLRGRWLAALRPGGQEGADGVGAVELAPARSG